MGWSTGSHCTTAAVASTNYTYQCATGANEVTAPAPTAGAIRVAQAPPFTNWQFGARDANTTAEEPTLYGYVLAAPAAAGNPGKEIRVAPAPGVAAAAASAPAVTAPATAPAAAPKGEAKSAKQAPSKAPKAAPSTAAPKAAASTPAPQTGASKDASPLALLSALRTASQAIVAHKRNQLSAAVNLQRAKSSTPVSVSSPRVAPAALEFQEAQAVVAWLSSFSQSDDAELNHCAITLQHELDRFGREIGTLDAQLVSFGVSPASAPKASSAKPSAAPAAKPTAQPLAPVPAAWADFCQSLAGMPWKDACNVLNQHLSTRTFLASRELDGVDQLALSVLTSHKESSMGDELESCFPHVARWYAHCRTQAQPAAAAAAAPPAKGKSGKGAAPEAVVNPLDLLKPLENAEYGKVVTRFPPEPSGYLHLGHVKACLLNEGYARKYGGKLIFRLDDTNPEKEEQEFADSMVEDLGLLGIHPDQCTATSDWFNELLEAGYKVIKEGNAYCDKTPQEQMQEERAEGIDSAYRKNSIEENLRLMDEMVKGTPEGLTCCVRGMMGMHHKNKALRDPVFFRCKQATHHRLGKKWPHKIFPCYDFACPIVDSWEGVTHALRDSNYTDRDLLYTWVCDAMKLRCPDRAFFSRLNFVYCELSKRKLGKLVKLGLVHGWDDPRMPTVKGTLNRGMSVEGLKQFMYEAASSLNITLQEWDKIWATNKACIDPVIPRFTVVEDPIKVELNGEGCPAGVELKSMTMHPKNPEVGDKIRRYTSTVWVDKLDVDSLKQGQEITLVDWGNCVVESISTDKVKAKLNLGGDVKKTAKITWIAAMNDTVPCLLIDLDHLLAKKELEEGDEIEDCLREVTWTEVSAVGEHALRTVKKGDKMQIMRKGYFICHQPYISEASPMLLIRIPDGKMKAQAKGIKK